MLALILLFSSLWASDEKVTSISFGPVRIGENRIDLDIDDFRVEVDTKIKVVRSAKLIPGSVQWIRRDKILLLPRARVALQLNHPGLHMYYNGRAVLGQPDGKGGLYTELYVGLFSPEPIEIRIRDKLVGYVYVSPRNLAEKKRDTKLVDYSCAPYDIELKGLEGEFISVGCQAYQVGDFGSERPMLEVHVSSPNYRLRGKAKPPYVAIFHDNKPVTIELENRDGTRRLLRIHVNLPSRLHRLRTALGVGPYKLRVRDVQGSREWADAGAFFLYMNYKLTQASSIKAFNALVVEDGLFNNGGLYFGYELGRGLDERIIFSTLLGAQVVSFRADSNADLKTEIIYPQGIEVEYKHPFGMTNYSLVYGMFFEPNKEYNYQNLWVRFGKRIFWELNYIAFERDNDLAKMWGLSVGIPVWGFF